MQNILFLYLTLLLSKNVFWIFTSKNYFRGNWLRIRNYFMHINQLLKSFIQLLDFYSGCLSTFWIYHKNILCNLRAIKLLGLACIIFLIPWNPVIWVTLSIKPTTCTVIFDGIKYWSQWSTLTASSLKANPSLNSMNPWCDLG